MEEYGFKKIEVTPFSELFEDMDKNGNNRLKNIANKMEQGEKDFSFLSNAFVYQKIRNAPDSLYSKLVKLMKKEETKKAKAEATKEVEETMDELKVEEVEPETEMMIEEEEQKVMS